MWNVDPYIPLPDATFYDNPNISQSFLPALI